MLRRLVLASSVAVCAVTATASAAPSVTYDHSCYGEGAILGETGAGFAPNSTVTEEITGGYLLAGGRFEGHATMVAPDAATDAAGGFERAMRVPELFDDGDLREFVVATFTDTSDPTLTTTTGWMLSAWDADFREWRKGKIAPGQKMTLQTWGWSGTERGDTLYLHYYRGSKRFGTTKVGKVTGDCGDLRKRIPQFPKAKVPAATYTVYLSTTAVLDKVGDAWLSFKVKVPASAARTARSNPVAGLTVRHPFGDGLRAAEFLGGSGNTWKR